VAAEQVIEATILAVTPDGNGWTKINTDQGDFSTKWPEPVAEAQMHVGQRVQIAYEMGEAKQSQRTGQWFPAPRYFKRVQSGYQAPQGPPPQFAGQQQPVYAQAPPMQQAPPPQVIPQPQQSTRGTRDADMEIMRQAAAKCAVWTMPLVPSEERTFQNQIAVAEAWLRYFVGGVEATRVRQPAAPALTQEQQMAMAGAPGQDDDIPF
jgi:hypothetical protein